MRDRCLNCNAVIERINYSLGQKWMHVDPSASFPTVEKGTAWQHCRQRVAEPRREGGASGADT